MHTDCAYGNMYLPEFLNQTINNDNDNDDDDEEEEKNHSHGLENKVEGKESEEWQRRSEEQPNETERHTKYKYRSNLDWALSVCMSA